MSNFVKIKIFPEEYFKDLNLENNNIDNIIKNLSGYIESIFSKYSTSELQKIYEKEKELIKKKNYKLVSSILNYYEPLKKFLEEKKINSVIQLDFFLYGKTNIFIDENFDNKEIIFVIKCFTIFEFLSVRNLNGLNFFTYTFEKNNSYEEKSKKVEQVKKKINQLGLDSDIFLLSDGFFCLDKKIFNYFILKLF